MPYVSPRQQARLDRQQERAWSARSGPVVTTRMRPPMAASVPVVPRQHDGPVTGSMADETDPALARLLADEA